MTSNKDTKMSTTTTITMSYEAAVAATVALGFERHEVIGRQARRMVGRYVWR